MRCATACVVCCAWLPFVHSDYVTYRTVRYQLRCIVIAYAFGIALRFAPVTPLTCVWFACGLRLHCCFGLLHALPRYRDALTRFWFALRLICVRTVCCVLRLPRVFNFVLCTRSFDFQLFRLNTFALRLPVTVVRSLRSGVVSLFVTFSVVTRYYRFINR